MRDLITGHHTTVGGVLCGLKVKMDSWNEKFGRGQGGPQLPGEAVSQDEIDKLFG